MEAGSFTRVTMGRSHSEMIYSSARLSLPFRMLEVRKESSWAPSYWEHPTTRACYEAVSRVVGKDDAEVARLLKAVGPFELEQCIGVWMPDPQYHVMWWPWLQNFYGCVQMGYFNPTQYIDYIWYDQALKRSMGH